MEKSSGQANLKAGLSARAERASPKSPPPSSGITLKLEAGPLLTDLRQQLVELGSENKELRRLNVELERRIVERTAQLQGLAVELTQAEERERRRLAQILHDHLQQMLFGAKLNLDMLRENCKDPPFQKQVTQIEDLLTGCIELSRSLTQELSPPV